MTCFVQTAQADAALRRDLCERSDAIEEMALRLALEAEDGSVSRDLIKLVNRAILDAYKLGGEDGGR